MHEERNRKCAGVLITCNNNIIIISVIVVEGNNCFRFGCHDKEEEYNISKIPPCRKDIITLCVGLVITPIFQQVHMVW